MDVDTVVVVQHGLKGHEVFRQYPVGRIGIILQAMAVDERGQFALERIVSAHRAPRGFHSCNTNSPVVSAKSTISSRSPSDFVQ